MPYLQTLSYVAQIQGALSSGLKNPAESFAKFSDKVSAALGKTVNNPVGETSRKSPTMLQSFMSRGDPLLSIDWIGIIVDNANPKALEWYYLSSIQTPSLSIEAKPVFRGGKMSHYAGVLGVENLNVSLYTDTTGKALKFASSWFSSVYDNETGNYQLPKDYKKNVYIYLLDSTAKQVCLLKYFGCFPTAWTSYNLEAGQANPLATTLDLTVDSFTIGDGDDKVAQQISILAANGG